MSIERLLTATAAVPSLSLSLSLSHTLSLSLSLTLCLSHSLFFLSSLPHLLNRPPRSSSLHEIIIRNENAAKKYKSRHFSFWGILNAHNSSSFGKWRATQVTLPVRSRPYRPLCLMRHTKPLLVQPPTPHSWWASRISLWHAAVWSLTYLRSDSQTELAWNKRATKTDVNPVTVASETPSACAMALCCHLSVDVRRRVGQRRLTRTRYQNVWKEPLTPSQVSVYVT